MNTVHIVWIDVKWKELVIVVVEAVVEVIVVVVIVVVVVVVVAAAAAVVEILFSLCHGETKVPKITSCVQQSRSNGTSLS